MPDRENARLQKDLEEKLQLTSDLILQLERRDEEIDFLHGQLTIKEAEEDNTLNQEI